jgi:DNA-binding NtrC family response regulator
VTHDDGNRLQQHEWPVNIGGLQNVVERAVILSRSGDRLRLAADRHQGMMDVRP